MAATIDQQFIEYVVKSLVSHPDDVKVDRSIDEKGVLLELTVHQEDLGRVIGKRGNTAQSIRTLLRALGTKNDARYNLKIVDVGGEYKKPEREERSESPVSDQTQQSEEPPRAEAPDSDGASQWAHLATQSDDDSSNDSTDSSIPDEKEDKEEEEPTHSSSSVVENTRKELEDLADLNI